LLDDGLRIDAQPGIGSGRYPRHRPDPDLAQTQAARDGGLAVADAMITSLSFS